MSKNEEKKPPRAMTRRSLLFGLVDRIRPSNFIPPEKPSLPGDELLARGRSLFLLGRYNEAIADFKEVLDRSPGDNQALLYTGLAYAKLNDAENAVANWKCYLDFSKPLVQREINLQLALHAEGMDFSPERAAAGVEEAIKRQE